MQNMTKMSKALSLVLRHRPEKAGITLRPDGFTEVRHLLDGMNRMQGGWSMAVLERIVAEDEKGRYSFNEDRTMIRANQGHTVKVEVPMEEREPPETLYHGTTADAADKILISPGISKMKRLHVHLSGDLETATKVGGRRRREICILAVRAGEMYRQGYKFLLSENGVWLTDFVPVGFVDRLENPNGQK